jgi:hypothetical protein
MKHGIARLGWIVPPSGSPESAAGTPNRHRPAMSAPQIAW